METKYEVISLFPTPLYTNIIPKGFLKDYIPLLDKEELIEKNNEHYGSSSRDTYILHKEEYIGLNDYILQHSTFYIENYFVYSYKDYKFSQSWVSVKNPNQEHLIHYHPNSLISGVLFYGDYQNDTSEICFYRKDRYSETVGHHQTSFDNLNIINCTNYCISFKSNLLILFPSFLQHSVSKNVTNIPRKSLSFNIVPKDGFGSKDLLNELKFNCHG